MCLTLYLLGEEHVCNVQQQIMQCLLCKWGGGKLTRGVSNSDKQPEGLELLICRRWQLVSMLS